MPFSVIFCRMTFALGSGFSPIHISSKVSNFSALPRVFYRRMKILDLYHGPNFADLSLMRRSAWPLLPNPLQHSYAWFHVRAFAKFCEFLLSVGQPVIVLYETSAAEMHVVACRCTMLLALQQFMRLRRLQVRSDDIWEVWVLLDQVLCHEVAHIWWTVLLAHKKFFCCFAVFRWFICEFIIRFRKPNLENGSKLNSYSRLNVLRSPCVPDSCCYFRLVFCSKTKRLTWGVVCSGYLPFVR